VFHLKEAASLDWKYLVIRKTRCSAPACDEKSRVYTKHRKYSLIRPYINKAQLDFFDVSYTTNPRFLTGKLWRTTIFCETLSFSGLKMSPLYNGALVIIINCESRSEVWQEQWEFKILCLVRSVRTARKKLIVLYYKTKILISINTQSSYLLCVFISNFLCPFLFFYQCLKKAPRCVRAHNKALVPKLVSLKPLMQCWELPRFWPNKANREYFTEINVKVTRFTCALPITGWEIQMLCDAVW
jgi:hypothetical protein